MTRRLPAVLLLALSACLPDRDNPVDPQNLDPPEIEIFRAEAFSCRQWVYPYVEGHDDLVESFAISPVERLQIDAFCRARCPIQDPGGAEDPDYVPNDCQESRVVAGAFRAREDAVACSGFDDDVFEGDPLPDGTAIEPLSLEFFESPLRGAAPATLDVLAWATLDEESFDLDVVEISLGSIGENALRADRLALVDTAGGLLVTDDLRGRLPADTVLFTRSLVTVDTQRVDLTLRSRNIRESAERRCFLSLRFDPGLEIAQHPQGISGGYGAHVAIGDLPLDGRPPAGGPLEIATSYRRADGRCFADLLYRDVTTLLRSWGRDGHAPIEALCRAGGEPPPVAFATVEDPAFDSLVVPVHAQGGTSTLHVLSATSAYRLSVTSTLAYPDPSAAAPSLLADVGDLDGDSLAEIAVVSGDRRALALCSAGAEPGCAALAVPACDGAPVERVLSVAPRAYGIVTTNMVAVVQSPSRSPTSARSDGAAALGSG